MFRLIILLILSSTTSLVVAQDKPKGYSLERYAVIWQNSLFTKTDSPKGRDIPNSSSYWTLAGTFSFPGGQGAMIVNRATGMVEQIQTTEKNSSGMILVEVLPSKESGFISVKVEHEGRMFWVSDHRARRNPSPTLDSTNPSDLADNESKASEHLRKAIVAK